MLDSQIRTLMDLVIMHAPQNLYETNFAHELYELHENKIKDLFHQLKDTNFDELEDYKKKLRIRTGLNKLSGIHV